MQDIHDVQDPGSARPPLVVVSRDDCIAAGECARIAPAVFDQDETDGTVLLRDGFTAADPRLRKQIRHAVAACPAGALDLVEDD
jgi:ferredoxin